jgi:uncharacterized pyridoxal phosphate-containing UPF0001 family protein
VAAGGVNGPPRSEAVAGSELSSAEVSARVSDIRERIAGAGGDPAAVSIVAVTKGFGPWAVRAAVDSGLELVGENYAQELLAKADAVGDLPVSWHYLGAVQRRKVRSLAAVVSCWQSVCRIEEGQVIAARAPGASVLVEVDVTASAARHGVRLSEAPALVERLSALDLAVQGLMVVGPPGPPEGARQAFREAARLRSQLGLSQLSAGMSDDLEIAVSEGSTMVRVGRALFGPRPARHLGKDASGRSDAHRMDPPAPGPTH